jgi:hypothetical protein
MVTPIKPASIAFTSDGTSTAFILDLSTFASLGLTGPGQQPYGVLTPTIAANIGPAVPAPTLSLVGNFLTVTLNAALPTDYLGALVLYTLSFLVQYTTLPVE